VHILELLDIERRFQDRLACPCKRPPWEKLTPFCATKLTRKMKILFIENRYSTLIWAKAAEALESSGHTVFWLVQNHLFAPDSRRVHTIPYPSERDCPSLPLDAALQAVADTDRALLHFGRQPSHYRFYKKRIEDVLDQISPDVVFGESTQFHELLAIARCKTLGIPYLAPNATRYPAGRLIFFKYDSFETVGGGGQSLDDADARVLLDDIIGRRVIPSYMEVPKANFLAKAKRLKEKLRVIAGWTRGERYVTPAPWVKFRLDRALTQARARWDTLAGQRSGVTGLDTGSRWVLYPLQMQPESNLDVFGQPWINQAKTMARAAQALAVVGATLVVKPNPKSKYEMSDELVECALAHENIIPLPHACPIGPVFKQAPVVLSVTGTVILESIFGSKPVGVLGTHGMTRLPGVTRLNAPEDIANLLVNTLNGSAVRATRSDALHVLKQLHATSYEALLWDPISRPDLMASHHVAQLQNAFVDVVSHLAQPAARDAGGRFPSPATGTFNIQCEKL
jgi:hypothetical protein